MAVTDAQVLSVLEGKKLTNKDIVSELGDDANPVEVRKILKRLESSNRIGVVDKRKTGGRGRPSSVWGLFRTEE